MNDSTNISSICLYSLLVWEVWWETRRKCISQTLWWFWWCISIGQQANHLPRKKKLEWSENTLPGVLFIFPEFLHLKEEDSCLSPMSPSGKDIWALSPRSRRIHLLSYIRKTTKPKCVCLHTSSTAWLLNNTQGSFIPKGKSGYSSEQSQPKIIPFGELLWVWGWEETGIHVRDTTEQRDRTVVGRCGGNSWNCLLPLTVGKKLTQPILRCTSALKENIPW